MYASAEVGLAAQGNWAGSTAEHAEGMAAVSLEELKDAIAEVAQAVRTKPNTAALKQARTLLEQTLRTKPESQRSGTRPTSGGHPDH